MNPVLEEIFADELKQLEERGMIAGEKKGINHGIELAKTVLRLSENGISPAEIVSKYNIKEDIVKKVLS